MQSINDYPYCTTSRVSPIKYYLIFWFSWLFWLSFSCDFHVTFNRNYPLSHYQIVLVCRKKKTHTHISESHNYTLKQNSQISSKNKKLRISFFEKNIQQGRNQYHGFTRGKSLLKSAPRSSNTHQYKTYGFDKTNSYEAIFFLRKLRIHVHTFFCCTFSWNDLMISSPWLWMTSNLIKCKFVQAHADLLKL